MRIIFLLVFVIIRAAFCGYTTKTINESKGYSGGFLMGVLLAELGILIAVFKKELPDAPPNPYRVVPVVNVLKKYHYPFVSPQVEPIDILKGNIYAEAEAGKVNIVFYLIHSLFLMLWYGTILGAYLWYVMGYTVYWLFKYKLFKKGTAEDSVNTAGNAPSIKDSVIGGVGSLKERAGSTASKLSQKTEGVKTDAVEKAALAKEKAGAAFAGLKGKAAALAADRKKAAGGDTLDDDVIADENFPVEEAYSESDIVRDTADYNEEESDAESFDLLYEKAMNTADDEESYDEEAASEAGYENDQSEEAVGDVEPTTSASSVDPTPAPPTSAQPKPAPRQFSYEEEKKSPVIFVLVGVIVVLLVGMGILGGMLLMKNKDNNGSDNSSNDEIITTTNASVQETTSEIVTTTQKTNAEAAENVSVVSEEEIENSKNNAIADLRNKLTSEFSNNGASLPELKATTDYDINGDDIPELIISYMGIVTRIHHIYHYNGSQYVELIECWGGLEISGTNHLILEEHEEGGKRFVYYELSNDYTLKKIDEIVSSPVQNGISYYRNGRQIDASEYYIAFNYYKDMNWQSIDYDYSIYAADSGNHEQSKQDQNASSMYTGYANIENAPSNMTFVDNSDSNVIPKGIIKTDSTGLNLRKGPGTSYEVILEIPKGDSVSVYGQNSEWCYVGWKAPTRTVDGSYPVFYGYVSKDYLSIGVG